MWIYSYLSFTSFIGSLDQNLNRFWKNFKSYFFRCLSDDIFSFFIYKIYLFLWEQEHGKGSEEKGEKIGSRPRPEHIIIDIYMCTLNIFAREIRVLLKVNLFWLHLLWVRMSLWETMYGWLTAYDFCLNLALRYFPWYVVVWTHTDGHTDTHTHTVSLKMV